jgi:hypothetical protein
MRTPAKRSLGSLIIACSVLMFALANAWAGSPDAQERAARKACLLGDVAKGTEILADLYLDTKNPTYVYNQARCFEQNGQNEQAILRFREYLRKAEGIKPAEVEAVEKRIKALEEKHGGASATPSPPPATTVIPVAPVPPPSPPPVALSPSPESLNIVDQPAPPVQKSDPIYKRWWFWSGVGVVVAGGVVAAVLLSTQSGARHSPPCATTGVTCVPQ